jgi:hypothetical protein
MDGSRTPPLAPEPSVTGVGPRHLLSALQPRRNPGAYAFVSAPAGQMSTMLQPLAVFQEAEGTTWILDAEHAEAAGLEVRFRAAWLTLEVPSGLADVGLTAAVASALAAAGIACNVVAALHHDHLFVPLEAAEAAIAVLEGLQRCASA